MREASNESEASPPKQWRKKLLVFLSAQLLVVGLVAQLLTRQSEVKPSVGGELIFSEHFEDPSILTETYQSESDQGHKAGRWVVKDGRLHGEKIHNAALWFKGLQLPEEVRVEFKAWALSDQGDVKCELFGDGETHQSGYIIIAGGWSNSTQVIARQDEHGEERRQDRRCSQGRGAVCVPKDEPQHWVIERRDGALLWFVNETLQLRFDDQQPLTGSGFAFNNWEASVAFDDLQVYALP